MSLSAPFGNMSGFSILRLCEVVSDVKVLRLSRFPTKDSIIMERAEDVCG